MPAWMPGASGDPVAVALERFIVQGREFVSVEDVASQFGGTRAEQVAGMAAAAGVTRRTAERWLIRPGEISPRTGRPKQRRDFARSSSAPELRAAALRRFISGRIATIRRNGLRMRIVAVRRFSRVTITQTMPSDKGGRMDFVYIGGADASPALNAWLGGDPSGAADELLDRFFNNYGMVPDELGTIEAAAIVA